MSISLIVNNLQIKQEMIKADQNDLSASTSLPIDPSPSSLKTIVVSSFSVIRASLYQLVGLIYRSLVLDLPEYKIKLAEIIKIKRMQNQLQSPSSFPTQGQPVSGQPSKLNSAAHSKGFDKTLPSNHIKHYISNPNLSLDFNHAKTSGMTSDSNVQSSSALKKNVDFCSPPSHTQYGFAQNQHSRGMRSQMTKSLIISENNNVDLPEEVSNLKKQLVKNMPKRQYRMSETMQDAPLAAFLTKKQELTSCPKDSNFFKKQSFEEGKESLRQVPSFLNRDRGVMDMKRSQVVESTFESNRMQLGRDFPKIPKPRPRKVTVDDFIQLKELGNGKYGRVYLVKEKYTNFVCALKVIEKKLLHEEEITDQFIREVKIQQFLNHPNIIKMYGCFDDSTNIYIILEVGTGGQLYHQLKKSQPLSEARIAFIMRQVCEAVNEIHSLRIIHRDIKPENIVLHDNIIKLCDFGWSVHQDNKLRTTFCGTPLYVCPQILKGREYDEKIDIWSIGIMMYEMVVGENPFKITKEEELIKIVKDQIKIPSYLFVSAEVRDFLDRCLQKNPNERGSIKELVNHPFFKKNQEKNDKSKVLNI